MNNLPTLQDLRDNVQIAYKNDALNSILNVDTPSNWLKNHPFATKTVEGKKVPILYLPIDKVEYLMTKIFQVWNVEVISTTQLFNSVSCHVRVHFKDPISDTMRFHDGVGAVGIQTDKGATAADMSAIKQDAVMKALPAAKSYAIKDACEHIGKIFGRDLNRPDSIAFQMSVKNPDEEIEQLTELFNLKRESLSADDVTNIERIISEKDVKSYKKAISKLQSV